MKLLVPGGFAFGAPGSGSGAAATLRLRELLLRYAPTALVVAASILFQVNQGTTPDVSWLIDLGERMLHGQTPYIDFYEANPPASILLYLPAVALARLLHRAPELIVKASVYGLVWLSLLVCRSIAAGGRRDVAPIGGARLAAYATILLVLPAGNFAEREHFIAIGLLPMTAALVRRASGSPVALHLAIVAGLAAGIALAVKPHFVFAIMLPAACVLWRRRQAVGELGRILLAPELLVAAGVALAYLAAVRLCFPAFLDTTLPMVLDLYVAMRRGPLELLLHGNMILWAATAGVSALLAAERNWSARYVLPLLASLGCLIAWLLQGKGWSYQGYPAVALALMTLCDVICDRPHAQPSRPQGRLIEQRILAPACLLLLLVRATVFFSVDPKLMEPLRIAASRLKPHPRMMAVGPCCFGHPLVRDVGGAWVGHLISTWNYLAAKTLLSEPGVSAERRHRLLGYIAAEKAITAQDIARKRPDYILVEAAFAESDPNKRPALFDDVWINSTPELAAAFSAYRQLIEVTVGANRVGIWGRVAP